MSNPTWSNVPTAWCLEIYGGFMYVANYLAGTISKIQMSDGSIVNPTWATGLSLPFSLIIDSTGTYMYVSDSSNSISKINMSDGSIVNASWASGLNIAAGIIIDSTGTYMYVAIFGNGTISKINMSDGSIVNASWASGLFSPQFLTIDSTETYMYTTNFGNGTISQILMTDGSIVNASYISGLNIPGDLTIYDNYIYVANYGNGNIGKYSLSPLPPPQPQFSKRNPVFNLGLFVRGKGGNHKIAAATINLGSTKGRGSSTRMFNYCNKRESNFYCLNQFITINK